MMLMASQEKLAMECLDAHARWQRHRENEAARRQAGLETDAARYLRTGAVMD